MLQVLQDLRLGSFRKKNGKQNWHGYAESALVVGGDYALWTIVIEYPTIFSSYNQWCIHFLYKHRLRVRKMKWVLNCMLTVSSSMISVVEITYGLKSTVYDLSLRHYNLGQLVETTIQFWHCDQVTAY